MKQATDLADDPDPRAVVAAALLVLALSALLVLTRLV